ncbi:hypothetical protein SIID45300_01059 [Candidatus Magnetaquicoccaceae bacterium FCR-1]|uniref:DUF1320 domain-containing protein n=1 Tax=Candidatus Magnetaquiglobus chichijimensis TaxID=3141448 RepID=A0ABQ0C777_9PROT
MSIYATPSDLLELFGASEIAGIARPDDIPPGIEIGGALLRLTITGGDRAGYTAQACEAAERCLGRMQRVLAQVSARMDSYFSARYPLPLSSEQCASAPLVSICADLARFAMDDDSVDRAVRTRHDDAVRWLERIASGQAILSGRADASAGGVGRVEATPGVVFFGAMDGY